MFNNVISLDFLTRKEHSIEVTLHNTENAVFRSVVQCSVMQGYCRKSEVCCSEVQFSAVQCRESTVQ